ncbi:MAG: DNA topoisomerase IV subunit A [Planctomycetes bacterium]|nr:DNA topoisomerase IV subunit A [Planctomycetota bacterium]
MTYLEPLMRRNFLEYASYVVVDRAIPDIRDGCKPVQRRIMHTLHEMDDGKFHKVANVIGECMKLHPHGDASIGDALVVLANKGQSEVEETLGYFIERQGTFGNVATGDGAAAARYIECRLTPLARDALFNPALTTFMKSYDGRNDEPEWLPAKVPVTLMLGTEGIAVGMATTILPHNFGELLQAQIKILKGQNFKLYPDFPTGGIADCSEYADGRGKVKVRARIEAVGDKTVVIRDIPFGTTTESVMDSIESAITKGKVKISSINDYTGKGRIEIMLNLQRGVYADEVIPQLYAYTDCEVSVNSNITVIRDRKPAELTISDILRFLTEQLQQQIKAELEHELKGLVDKQHALTLEQIFIENRVYKRIETAKTSEAVDKAVVTGMEAFKDQFIRDLVAEDVARLLEIRIRRISQFDIDKHRAEIDDIVRAIKAAKAKLKDLVGTTVGWIEAIHAKYAKLYPRRTKVKTMEEIDKKAVANANLKLGYDQATGFFGSSVRASDRELKVTEYDRILAIFQDGSYRIMAPPEKTLLEGKLILLDTFDQEKGFEFTVIYRDKQKIPWAKRVKIQGFIKDKEYELIKERAGKIDYFSKDAEGTATCHMVPQPRLRITEESFDLRTLELSSSPQARGTRIAERPTQKVVVSKSPMKE